MPRLSKVLPLALAVVVVALAIFLASCTSSNTQYRIFNAMAFNPQYAVDIYVGVVPPASPTFSDVGLESTEPGSSGYQKVSAGADTTEVFQTGTTSSPYFNGALNLGAGNSYTVVLSGNGVGAPFAAQVVTDTNPTPTSGEVEFRILDFSPSTQAAVDVYVDDPQFGCCHTKVGSDLSYPSSTGGGSFNSGYANVGVPTSNKLGVYVTYTGGTEVIASTSYGVDVGQLYTVVLLDQSSGGFPPQLALLTP